MTQWLSDIFLSVRLAGTHRSSAIFRYLWRCLILAWASLSCWKVNLRLWLKSWAPWAMSLFRISLYFDPFNFSSTLTCVSWKTTKTTIFSTKEHFSYLGPDCLVLEESWLIHTCVRKPPCSLHQIFAYTIMSLLRGQLCPVYWMYQLQSRLGHLKDEPEDIWQWNISLLFSFSINLQSILQSHFYFVIEWYWSWIDEGKMNSHSFSYTITKQQRCSEGTLCPTGPKVMCLIQAQPPSAVQQTVSRQFEPIRFL